MPNPLINIGSAANDGTGELGPRGWLQKINQLPNSDSTINAGSGDYTGTTEQKITAAIAAAVLAAKKYVWVPQSMLPYNPSLVTFSASVKMVCEGGASQYYDVKAYGGAADGVQAEDAAINAAIAAAAVAVAGDVSNDVFLAQGTHLVNNQIKLLNKMRLIGVSRSGSVLQASASFPPSTALLRIGQGTGIVFGTRPENLTIDCNNIAGSIGIYSTEAQEQSGPVNCVIQKFRAYGVQFDSGVQHSGVELCEVYASTSGATAGVFWNQTSGSGYIRRCTINGDVASPMTDGILINNSLVDAHGVHCEYAANALRFTNGGSGVVMHLTGHASITDVLHIDASASNEIAAFGLYTLGATNTVNDARSSRILSAAVYGNVGWYMLGGGSPVSIFDPLALTMNRRIASGQFYPSEAVLVSGIDAALGNSLVVVLTANRVVGTPLNPQVGQRLTFTLAQDGTGGRTVTWPGSFKVVWSDTGNTLNKRSSISFIYDGSAWNQDGAQTPYV